MPAAPGPAVPGPAAAGPLARGIAEDSNLGAPGPALDMGARMGGASRCCEGNDEGAAVARGKGRTRTGAIADED